MAGLDSHTFTPRLVNPCLLELCVNSLGRAVEEQRLVEIHGRPLCKREKSALFSTRRIRSDPYSCGRLYDWNLVKEFD